MCGTTKIISIKKPYHFLLHTIYEILYLCGGFVYYAYIVATSSSKSLTFYNLYRFLATLKCYILEYFLTSSNFTNGR